MILTANFIAGDTELSPADKVAANFISVRASRVLRRAAIVREPQQGGLRRRKEFLGQWLEVLRGGGERLDRALGLVSLSHAMHGGRGQVGSRAIWSTTGSAPGAARRVTPV
jgi:hypothetical protein